MYKRQHQGWLTEDQRHFLLNDELDEQQSGVPTSTYIFDVADLRAFERHGLVELVEERRTRRSRFRESGTAKERNFVAEARTNASPAAAQAR